MTDFLSRQERDELRNRRDDYPASFDEVLLLLNHIDALERQVDIYRHERDRFFAMNERLIKTLVSIEICTTPPDFEHEGKTIRFVDPDPHTRLRILSERIREIPEEIAKAALAGAEGEKNG